MVIKLGFKGIKGGGSDGESGNGQRHPRRGASGAGEAAARKISDRARGGAVRKTKLTCGVHMSARGEREGDADGGRDLEKYNMSCHAMHPMQDLFLGSFSQVL
jgi:hypothetical protein